MWPGFPTTDTGLKRFNSKGWFIRIVSIITATSNVLNIEELEISLQIPDIQVQIILLFHVENQSNGHQQPAYIICEKQISWRKH